MRIGKIRHAIPVPPSLGNLVNYYIVNRCFNVFDGKTSEYKIKISKDILHSSKKGSRFGVLKSILQRIIPKTKMFPDGESNPGRGGESAES